eukprot:5243196-Pleurochrysis_carterae.AAC.2
MLVYGKTRPRKTGGVERNAALLQRFGAVVLNRQHHRVVGGEGKACGGAAGRRERALADGLDHTPKRNSARGRVLVVHLRLSVRPTKDVNLDATKA